MTFGETLLFCTSSIRHRFSRSLLTLSVVVLAVAFFMFLQSSNIFRESVGRSVEKDIIESRYASSLLGMMYSAFPRSAFVKLVADSEKDARYSELLQSVLSVSKTEVHQLSLQAGQELDYLEFIESIGFGQRKMLFGRMTGRESLMYLTSKENFSKFEKNLLELKTLRVPGGLPNLAAYLKGYKDYSDQISKLFQVWNEQRLALQKATDSICGDQPLRQFLMVPGNEEKWEQVMKANHFQIDKTDIKSVLDYLSKNILIERVQQVLLQPEYRKKWRLAYGQQKYTRMEEKMMIIDSSTPMDILKEDFTRDELKLVGREFRTRKALRDLEMYLEIDVNSRSDSFLSGRHIYLMVLSFIVCMVGIANAMLMSITERFREIATLKCLGATDSFILVQIMIEAFMQGAVGGAAGVIIGLLAAIIGTVAQVGMRVFSTFDFSQILVAAVLSFVSGIILAVIASLYPSTRAARMAPMEAMRVE